MDKLSEAKRTLIALVLTFLVLVAWNTFFPPPEPSPETEPEVQASSPGPTAVAPSPSAVAPVAPLVTDPGEVVVADGEQNIRIVSDLYTVEIANRGGIVVDWTLERYAAEARWPGDAPSGPVQLWNQEPNSQGIGPLSVLSGDKSLDARLLHGLFEIDGPEPDANGNIILRGEEQAEIHLSWADGAGSRVEKTLLFSAQTHEVKCTVKVELAGGKQPYLVIGPGLGPPVEDVSRGGYEGQAVLEQGDDIERHNPASVGLKDLRSELGSWPPLRDDWLTALEQAGEVDRYRTVHWAGIEESFFAALVLTETPWQEVLVFPALDDLQEERARLVVAVPIRNQGETMSLYVGPKKAEILEAIRPDLVRVIDYGEYFKFFAKLLLTALLFFHGHLVSLGAPYDWALSIILLTCVIKILFIPLTAKQLETSSKMAKLQPQIKALEAKYKKQQADPKKKLEANQKMQQERMELFKREGVNPLAGCLPLFAYLPFMYGFYRLLSASIELRHAPFLWVPDLSSKDPAYVLPIFMVISMVVQQALTPSTMDNAQKWLMRLMPLFFGWILKDLASGLVLFWLTQNILSIVQQVVVNKKNARADAAEKDQKRKPKKQPN